MPRSRDRFRRQMSGIEVALDMFPDQPAHAIAHHLPRRAVILAVA